MPNGDIQRYSGFRRHALATGTRAGAFDSIEAGVWGQNLLEDHHAEANSHMSPFRGEVPHSFLGRLTWRF
jgi:hypothetical protein